MLLSIIIPVYNVEPFVEKCIRSCLNQDIPTSNYEIIVINDGSTDNSLAIVQRLSNEFSTIRVFSQPNAGLSAARNLGMFEAKGDYYMFVDSDDWISANCLKKISNVLVSEQPDALAIGAANIIDGEIVKINSYDGKTSIKGRDLLKKGVSPCAQLSIWSSHFLKRYSLSFFNGIYHEDSEFTPRAYYYANNVSIINDIVYYFYPNPKSITRSINPKKSFDLVNVVCPHLSEFSKTVLEEYKSIYHDLISMYLNNALSSILNTDKNNQRLLNHDIYEHKELFVHLKKSSKYKYRIEALLFSLFPKHYIGLYKLLKCKF